MHPRATSNRPSDSSGASLVIPPLSNLSRNTPTLKTLNSAFPESCKSYGAVQSQKNRPSLRVRNDRENRTTHNRENTHQLSETSPWHYLRAVARNRNTPLVSHDNSVEECEEKFGAVVQETSRPTRTSGKLAKRSRQCVRMLCGKDRIPTRDSFQTNSVTSCICFWLLLLR